MNNPQTAGRVRECILDAFKETFVVLGEVVYEGAWTFGDISFELWKAPITLSNDPRIDRVWVGVNEQAMVFSPDGSGFDQPPHDNGAQAAEMMSSLMEQVADPVRVWDNTTPSA